MTSVAERYAWLDRAACVDRPDWDEDTCWWEQLKVCGGCPVRRPCLDSAIELGTDGVRGGTTPGKRLTKAQRRHAGTDAYIRMTDGRPDPPLVDGDLMEMCRRILGYGTETWRPLTHAGGDR